MSQDTDDFYRALAGQPVPPEGGSADARLGAEIRRIVLEAEDAESLRLAQEVAQGVSKEDQALVAASLQRLRASGLLADSVEVEAGGPAATSARDPRPRSSPAGQGGGLRAVIEGITSTLFGSAWQKGLAFAAVAVLGVAVVLQFGPGRHDDSADTLRGGGGLELRAADPQAAQADLVRKLEQAGAQVVSVRISEREWNLDVTVPDPGKLAAVEAVLRSAGLNPGPALRFTVTVTDSR